MKKILLFGSGLFVLNWTRYASDCLNFVVSRSKNNMISCEKYLQLTIFSEKNIHEVVSFVKPDIIVNALAMTNIEYCELNPNMAYSINANIPKNIAKACNDFKIPMVQLSTDHFESEKNFTRNEFIDPIPVNTYGLTKLEGEKFVNEILSSHQIIRTNFFGWGDADHKSSAQKIIESLRQSKNYYGFEDIVFNPLSLDILVHAIEELITQQFIGVINLSSNHKINKYEFARILSNRFKLNDSLIFRSNSKHFSSVKRPKMMALNNDLSVKILSNMNFDLKNSIDNFYKDQDT